jgi:Protein of unknown function (DUF4231)
MMIESTDLDQACQGAAKIVTELYDREVGRFDLHARRSFRFYRGFGILVILLSASLPFLTTLQEPTLPKFVVPLVAAMISALSSVTVFMAYGDSWNGYRTAEIRTRYARAKWENSLFQAKLEPKVEDAMKLVKEATATFINDVQQAAGAETQSFFQAVKDSASKVSQR